LQQLQQLQRLQQLQQPQNPQQLQRLQQLQQLPQPQNPQQLQQLQQLQQQQQQQQQQQRRGQTQLIPQNIPLLFPSTRQQTQTMRAEPARRGEATIPSVQLIDNATKINNIVVLITNFKLQLDGKMVDYGLSKVNTNITDLIMEYLENNSNINGLLKDIANLYNTLTMSTLNDEEKYKLKICNGLYTRIIIIEYFARLKRKRRNKDFKMFENINYHHLLYIFEEMHNLFKINPQGYSNVKIPRVSTQIELELVLYLSKMIYKKIEIILNGIAKDKDIDPGASNIIWVEYERNEPISFIGAEKEYIIYDSINLKSLAINLGKMMVELEKRNIDDYFTKSDAEQQQKSGLISFVTVVDLEGNAIQNYNEIVQLLKKLVEGIDSEIIDRLNLVNYDERNDIIEFKNYMEKIFDFIESNIYLPVAFDQKLINKYKTVYDLKLPGKILKGVCHY
jgi:hypothetical protein